MQSIPRESSHFKNITYQKFERTVII